MHEAERRGVSPPALRLAGGGPPAGPGDEVANPYPSCTTRLDSAARSLLNRSPPAQSLDLNN